MIVDSQREVSIFQCVVRCSEQGSLCHIIACIAVSRGRSRNFKGGGGVRRNFLPKGGGGGGGSSVIFFKKNTVWGVRRAICVANKDNLLKKRGGGGLPGSALSSLIAWPIVYTLS